MKPLPWPLPAVIAWVVCWLVFFSLAHAGVPALWSMWLAMLPGLLGALLVAGWWRRVMLAAGFPLALWASGAAVVPVWAWPVLLLLLLLLYPVRAWRDAPIFPTPPGALDGLPAHAPLPVDARVLDAGCGLGHGLVALRAAYPHAAWHGIEWSWPLRAWCALRCPWARVWHADIWKQPWGGYDLVYLFQRPESMARARDKAAREMHDGSWLVSLEFEVPGVVAHAQLPLRDGRMLWVYRMPLAADAAVVTSP